MCEISSSTVAARQHPTAWSDLSPIEDRICHLIFASGGAANSTEEGLGIPFAGTFLQSKTIRDLRPVGRPGLKIIYFTL
jgi:hypothetical protein